MNLTLGAVLQGISDFPEGAWLYLPADEPWTLETRAMMIEGVEELACDEVDSQDPKVGYPPIALELGLNRVLYQGQIEDIIHNLKDQGVRLSPAQLLEAFLYYYDNDAFLEVAP